MTVKHPCVPVDRARKGHDRQRPNRTNGHHRLDVMTATKRSDLRALMERVAKRETLDDEEAMAVAVGEVRAVRTARSTRHTA